MGREDNIKPHKMKKGETRNPNGGSRKARQRAALRSRLEELRAAVRKKDTGSIDDRLALEVLTDGMNYTADELRTLMEHALTPISAKVMLKEMVSDPRFALTLLQTLVKATDGAPAATPTEDEEARRIETAAQVQAVTERIRELLKVQPKK